MLLGKRDWLNPEGKIGHWRGGRAPDRVLEVIRRQLVSRLASSMSRPDLGNELTGATATAGHDGQWGTLALQFTAAQETGEIRRR